MDRRPEGAPRSGSRLYPDRGRFTVVIWGRNRGSFREAPEQLYGGKRIRVAGLISTYKGSPQIEVDGPEDIQVVK